VKTWQFICGILSLAIATVLFMFMTGDLNLYGGIVLTIVGIFLITTGRRIEMEKKSNS
jgi:hypothetical protein